MPGVPPDAIAQVKKSFRSLFSRKPKAKAAAVASTVPDATATADTANPIATTSPQIAEPANVHASQNIDLNPDAAPPVSSKPTVEGMSATSGPLSDGLDGGYGADTGDTTTAKAEPVAKPAAAEEPGKVAEGQEAAGDAPSGEAVAAESGTASEEVASAA